MCPRSLHIVISCLVCTFTAPAAGATDVMMHFFPLTGEVRMQNFSTVPFEFVLYSIKSPGDTLNGANGVWKSISDTYDVSGNGFIDPVNNWMELSAQPDELTEAVFGATPGILPASRSVSLGKVWNPNALPAPDLEVEVIKSNNQPAIVEIQFSLDGDYNLNDEVDQSDFELWKDFYGITFAPFMDGNLNGIVDTADYTVWRDNLGATLIGSAFASEFPAPMSGVVTAATAVPEASTGVLLFVAFAALGGRRYWTRTSTS